MKAESKQVKKPTVKPSNKTLGATITDSINRVRSNMNKKKK